MSATLFVDAGRSRSIHPSEGVHVAAGSGCLSLASIAGKDWLALSLHRTLTGDRRKVLPLVLRTSCLCLLTPILLLARAWAFPLERLVSGECDPQLNGQHP